MYIPKWKDQVLYHARPVNDNKSRFSEVAQYHVLK